MPHGAEVIEDLQKIEARLKRAKTSETLVVGEDGHNYMRTVEANAIVREFNIHNALRDIEALINKIKKG